METIEQISHKIFYQMEKYNQLTNDLIEETEELLNNDEDKEIMKINLDALYYKINNTIKIFNPLFNKEIERLKCFLYCIDLKIKELNKN